MLSKKTLLFLTILIEGYVVLAVELLAMRTLIPFVGSGTEVVALVISAVLLPLAIGYHHGGTAFQRQYRAAPGKKRLSIRKILLKNLINSLIIFTLGLSYVMQELFFGLLLKLGIDHHILQTALFCLCFLVYPVYLLAQTIPLLSNYFSSEHLSAVTGRMLFFSTLGSFGGSVFSTIVLMTTIGVHNTLLVTLTLLVMVVMLLNRRWFDFNNAIVLMMLGVAFALNSPAMMQQMNIVENNQYSMVKIYDREIAFDEGTPHKWRVMDINRSFSSLYHPTQRAPYIVFIEDNILSLKHEKQPLDVLIIGAGGFALGQQDTQNRYTYVDIDASLKRVAEQHFLPEKLGRNKKFVAMSARAFLRQTHKEYDVIILDAFSNVLSIPQEAITRDFLVDAKSKLRKGGVLVSNVIASPTYQDKFSARYANTFASVFPQASHQIIGRFDAWSPKKQRANLLYLYFDHPFVNEKGVYTDDRNTHSLDRNGR